MDSGRRRRLALVALAAAAASVTAVAVTTVHRRDDHVADAIAIASHDDDYDTGVEAGRTLARVASALNLGIRACDRDDEPDRCAALGAASGYTQVVAAMVVRCTAPGRAEARASVLAVLEDLRARRPGDPPPRPPPIPDCRG
jgi:hypothetical protein